MLYAMKKYKIIIDTNLWVSLLIGKHLLELRSLCNHKDISVFFCTELKSEFERVATSEKIKKYVTKERINKTLELMENSCLFCTIENVADSPIRDKNDLFLLSFADTIFADYILTGDKDLLILQKHNRTKIVTYKEFETILNEE